MINASEHEGETSGPQQPIPGPLHELPYTMRLYGERTGTTDSLAYNQVKPGESALHDGCVEVEAEPAELNFKDVAIMMGIIPENERLLGLEGASVIRRLGSRVDQNTYHVGHQVLFFERGTFANRIQATTERVHPIPDSMSFEQASTLASVYLAVLYSLYDLANTQPGHLVLIHSATGGLGLATIQLCQYIGAEVFATAGTHEKRAFLSAEYGIPAHHIYSSCIKAFASEIMRLTQGHGVDVILNSLMGDLLDTSWV